MGWLKLVYTLWERGIKGEYVIMLRYFDLLFIERAAYMGM